MALVKGWPRTGSAPLWTKKPALPPGTMCFHSSSTMKFSYSRSVRRTPVGTPVETMRSSRTDHVLGAQLMFVQPVRSRPLNKGCHSAERTGVARSTKTKAAGCMPWFCTRLAALNRTFCYLEEIIPRREGVKTAHSGTAIALSERKMTAVAGTYRKLSILVAAYNEEATLRRCLTRVMNTSLPDGLER